MKTITKVEQKFGEILESLPDAIIIVNGDGIIQIVNSQAEMLFDYTREEIVGKEVEVLMPSQQRHEHYTDRKGFWDNLATQPNGTTGQDLIAKRKDGTKFPVRIRFNKLEIEESVFVLASIRDVSFTIVNTPEPSTQLLILSAIAALIAVRLKRHT